jgi:Hypervirulence associated proteins TUDOR domain
MSRRFKIGDHVRWNSEAGRVGGRIIKVHTRDANYKGHMHRASPEEPQYEIRSDRTDHIAMHKGTVLTKLRQ